MTELKEAQERINTWEQEEPNQVEEGRRLEEIKANQRLFQVSQAAQTDQSLIASYERATQEAK
jgi:hypothetical protein